MPIRISDGLLRLGIDGPVAEGASRSMAATGGWPPLVSTVEA